MAARSVQAIDKKSIHQICSGQVVLSIATAMKELVENSLDAAATNIDIRLKDYGAELLEVIDNGSGVEPHNFEALTLKHHTSKLRDFSDLASVETFGFRGEALSSLCALSNLSIVTHHSSQAAATRLEYDHSGKLVSKTPCARGHGTTVTLLNLFSTLPVRHKEFIRNIKKEFTKLVHVLQGYCLVSTGVRITCSNQVEKGKKTAVLSTNGSEHAKDNITCVFGTKQIQTLMAFEQTMPSEEDCSELGLDAKKIGSQAGLFKITGFVSKPGHGMGRSSADRQFFYINKRPCELGKISRTVNEVYHMYNRHQFPFVMLDVSLARDAVDVNVTPDKRQVFIQEERVLLVVIKTSLKRMFDPSSATFDMNEKPLTQIKLPKAFVRTNGTSEGCDVAKIENLQPSESLCEKHEQGIKVGQKPAAVTISSEKKSVFPCLSSFKRKLSSLDEDCQHKSEQPTPKQIKLTSIFSCDSDTSHQESVKTFSGFDRELHFRGKTYHTEANFGDITTDKHEPRDDEEQTNGLTRPMPAMADKFHHNEFDHHLGNGKLDNFQVGRPEAVEKPIKILNVVPSVTTDKEKHTMSTKKLQATTSLKGRKEVTVSFSMTELKTNSRKTTIKHSGEVEARQFRAKISPDSNSSAEKELKKNVSKDMFSKMEILGQFNLGFIITKLGNDLFIIDQHASDEKFNFEEQQQNTAIRSQRLIAPQKLELTAVNEAILIDNIEIFQKNGFEFEIDEGAEPTKRIKLSSLPVSKNWTFGLEDVEELIFMLSDSPGAMCRPSRVRKMFASRACRMSIMVGTALSHAQMKKVVCQMGQIEQPWNCPHGRPTMRHLINLGMIPNLD